ncbi:hypothetical protein [Anabaena sp. CS-542/02]|uniref:hypothetical protein n=1 Tax=Anabaena sp. CS-542/02 TaxID=3021719 RepID=UPI00232DB627|nr:hypothetical protein [Anabaena sp. CS-542/02]MDB9448209.1 hypothetical protein [Anabaena sp. CS-542/02]
MMNNPQEPEEHDTVLNIPSQAPELPALLNAIPSLRCRYSYPHQQGLNHRGENLANGV